MKLLGLVIQNKKGENLLIASSSSLSTRMCVIYSHIIFEHILESYRTRLRIQRTITLEYDLSCTCNISKDYILYIYSSKNDLPMAIDGIRKIIDHFNRPGSTPAARIQAIPKKFVEYMSMLEQFLYCRQIPLREFMPMQPQKISKRKSIDYQIFNKFSHISSENDKKTILDTEIISNKIQANEMKKKCKIIDHAEAFQLKSQDQIYLLDIDPDKEAFVNSYRKGINRLALGKRRVPSQRVIDGKGKSNLSLLNENREQEEMIEFLEEPTMEKEKIKLKIMEKLTLHLHNEKVKEVHQLGQLIVEGNQGETNRIQLKGQKVWKNPKVLSKRLSPNSLQSTMLNEMQIEFKTVQGYKSKPIVDYVIRTDTFSPEKIPLLFIYSMEVNSNNIEFTFKYKMNERWKHRIFDFDINVYLNKEFVVLDCRSIPVAHSLKNNKVTWKTKQINPHGSNSKGKILLAFGQAKFPPKRIIQQIKLTMKSPCGLLETLDAQCHQQWGYIAKPDKTLIIQYRISPN